MRKIIYWSVIGLIAASSFSAEGTRRMRERAAAASVHFSAGDSLGLTNSGGTCFLNAAMQAVFVCESLRDNIRVLDGDALKEGSRPFVKAVKDFINEMIAEGDGKDGAYINTGSRLTDGLAHDVLQYIPGPGAPNWASTGDQQDAEEFLSLMLDQISEAFTPENAGWKENFDSMRTTRLEITENGDQREELCPIFSLQIMQPPQAAQASQDLQTLLNSNMDYIDDMDVHITKRPLYLPAVLIVQLGRFDDNLNKIKTPVTPSEDLQLSEGDTTAHYILKAVIVHDGNSTTSGHYYTYQRVRGDWWRRDDRSTQPLPSLPSDVTTDGYIFFYERV